MVDCLMCLNVADLTPGAMDGPLYRQCPLCANAKKIDSATAAAYRLDGLRAAMEVNERVAGRILGGLMDARINLDGAIRDFEGLWKGRRDSALWVEFAKGLRGQQ